MTAWASKVLVGAALCAMVATPVLATKASQLTDINGSRGRDAETMLQQRGFAHVSTHKSDSNFVNSYWWNERDDNCVVVEVADGRVMTINDASDQDCGHHKGGAGAAGAVIGAALLGALLSHKSHHHDENQHNASAQYEANYERGYNDGLYNAPYHNYDRADGYANGYEAGVSERSANLRYHSGRGGYVQTAQIADLKDARAAGGMEELERRGFRQVDNFTSGNTRYSIQWRAASRQCVQVTIADGHFYDLREIGQHPGCR
jgi:hypothetical protein